MRVPDVAKAGRLAVTMTPATLRTRSWSLSDVDAEAIEHRLQRLLGEGRVAHRVAGALQADHQPVAEELVLAHALNDGDVLDPRRLRRAEANRRGNRDGEKNAFHRPSIRIAAVRLHRADDDLAAVDVAHLDGVVERTGLEGQHRRGDDQGPCS